MGCITKWLLPVYAVKLVKIRKTSSTRRWPIPPDGPYLPGLPYTAFKTTVNSLVEKCVPPVRPKSKKKNLYINPRTPGGFGRTPTPGGGLISAPPLRSRKLRRLEKNGKRRLVDWEKHYKKHSDNFSLKSKLRSPEVIKGKIFPNFRIT